MSNRRSKKRIITDQIIKSSKSSKSKALNILSTVLLLSSIRKCFAQYCWLVLLNCIFGNVKNDVYSLCLCGPHECGPRMQEVSVPLLYVMFYYNEIYKSFYLSQHSYSDSPASNNWKDPGCAIVTNALLTPTICS